MSTKILQLKSPDDNKEMGLAKNEPYYPVSAVDAIKGLGEFLENWINANNLFVYDAIKSLIDITTGANGKSAYDLAVDNGYTGTVTEWLTSLKGAAGPAGATGPAGKDAVISDTGWKECVVASGTDTSKGLSSFQVRVIGKVAYINATVFPKAIGTVFANISTYVTMHSDWDVRIPAVTSNGGIYTIIVKNDGTVSLLATTYTNNALNGSWCHIKDAVIPIN